MSEQKLGIIHEVLNQATQRMTVELSKFISALKEGKLLTTKCKKCGKKHMPPRFKCPCGGTELDWVEVKPEGTLYSWSIVHFAPEEIARKTNVPYVAGIIELEDGLLLLGHVKGLASKPKVGMKVKVVPQVLDSGNLAYYIKPA